MSWAENEPCVDLYFSLPHAEVVIGRRVKTSDGYRYFNYDASALPLPPDPMALGKAVAGLLKKHRVVGLSLKQLTDKAPEHALLADLQDADGQDAFFRHGHCIAVWHRTGRNEYSVGATWTEGLGLDPEVRPGPLRPTEFGEWIVSWWDRVRRSRWPNLP